ncbi:formate dehydrogenase major subunit [Carboxydocella sporoproducens DSM 16521]|uniref:Formate dehydrogenase major subunit n=3 Tax=Carboxydocella TaxID=178898 RepID=A0A1T4RW30_9FIRM|nr:formate dehydrogenase major subunit [Carboxydocella thermautotrophica]AVX30691.1 formate dehydrogenase major subunit [Carboxydocella thermautotrophica]GAW29180.1 formate dehydrogenase [Carboxydocella sp. ULO1]SKA20172.1 formate dehydrogenase major subunit [Carboxydocella sporoproducens DSM 16521]
MLISRRRFLQLIGVSTAATLISGLEFLQPDTASAISIKLTDAVATPTICSFCSVGCGLLVHTKIKDGVPALINIEGDPDHPINRGSVCSKGAASFQIRENSRRITTPLYRAPGSNAWVAKDWNWMLDTIASRIKTLRDETFIEMENGLTVNRTEAIACLGGAALDNEEAYLLTKFMRGLGVVYLEHQARV